MKNNNYSLELKGEGICIQTLYNNNSTHGDFKMSLLLSIVHDNEMNQNDFTITLYMKMKRFITL